MDTKRCYKCGRVLSKEAFNKCRSKYDGLSSECKDCVKEESKRRYWANREQSLQKSKEQYEANRETRKEKQRAYYNAHKKERNEWHKKRNKERRATDPLFLVKGRLRVRFGHALRRYLYRKKDSVLSLIGCSVAELLEKLGPMPSADAQIDHKCPVSQARTEEELEKLFHYSNLQWLSARENMAEKRANRTPEGERMCLLLLGREWID